VAPSSSSSLWHRPATRVGWWAVCLTCVYIVMIIINSAVFMQLEENTPMQLALLPYYGILMLLCGLAGGILGLIALIVKHDRSWMVWLTLLPGAFVVFLLLGEFLVPH